MPSLRRGMILQMTPQKGVHHTLVASQRGTSPPPPHYHGFHLLAYASLRVPLSLPAPVALRSPLLRGRPPRSKPTSAEAHAGLFSPRGRQRVRRSWGGSRGRCLLLLLLLRTPREMPRRWRCPRAGPRPNPARRGSGGGGTAVVGEPGGSRRRQRCRRR